MSKIFPSIFPYLGTDEMERIGRQTEYEVYKKLADSFDDKFEVLCGPKFIYRNFRGNLREGEYADFIILHPTKGMMFLECKGGNITYNATEKKWYQNNKVLIKIL